MQTLTNLLTEFGNYICHIFGMSWMYHNFQDSLISVLRQTECQFSVQRNKIYMFYHRATTFAFERMCWKDSSFPVFQYSLSFRPSGCFKRHFCWFGWNELAWITAWSFWEQRSLCVMAGHWRAVLFLSLSALTRLSFLLNLTRCPEEKDIFYGDFFFLPSLSDWAFWVPVRKIVYISAWERDWIFNSYLQVTLKRRFTQKMNVLLPFFFECKTKQLFSMQWKPWSLHI